jgi:hypothetical protein
VPFGLATGQTLWLLLLAIGIVLAVAIPRTRKTTSSTDLAAMGQTRQSGAYSDGPPRPFQVPARYGTLLFIQLAFLRPTSSSAGDGHRSGGRPAPVTRFQFLLAWARPNTRAPKPSHHPLLRLRRRQT